jgi:hypothetical protein
MWPSITFQPVQLTKAMLGATVWRRPDSLPPEERADWREAAAQPEAKIAGESKMLPVIPAEPR